MRRHANRALTGFKKADPVRRAEGSPPEGEGRIGPGRMASVGSRFLTELLNPKEVAKDVSNVGRSYLDMLSAFNTFLYQRSPEEQIAFLQSLPEKTRTAVGQAKTALRNLPQTAKEAVETATPESTAAAVRRFGVESAMDPTRLMKSTKPVMSEVVRPTGDGIVLDFPDAPPVPIEKRTTAAPPGVLVGEAPEYKSWAPKGYVARTIDEALEYLDNLDLQGQYAEKATAIRDFLNTKVRGYYTKQFGTKNDPIFEAIKTGKISTERLNRPGGIREYLVSSAREGKTRVSPETGETRFFPSRGALQALEDINRIYDRMTGMKGTVIGRGTIGQPTGRYSVTDEASTAQQNLNELMQQKLIDERVRATEVNPDVSYIGYVHPEQAKALASPKELLVGADYSTPTKEMAALALADPSTLPKALRTAIEKGQPIYDIKVQDPALREILDEKDLINYLVSLSPREIKNLRYEDAIKRSVKSTEQIRARRAVVQRIRENKPVEPKVYLEGVSEPLISYPENAPFSGFTWRRITDPEATAIEGAYIGHSVGGYAKGGMYGPQKHQQFLDGEIEVYTLRDERGRPVTTVEVQKDGRGPVVTQVKGAGRSTGNIKPSAYDAALIDLFNKLDVGKISESDLYLPPLSINLKNELMEKGRRPRQPKPIPAPEQQGIGQLPQAPQDIPNAENFAQGMDNRQLMEFVRRLFRDQD